MSESSGSGNGDGGGGGFLSGISSSFSKPGDAGLSGSSSGSGGFEIWSVAVRFL